VSSRAVHTIAVKGSDCLFNCDERSSLLMAMAANGTVAITIGCRAGGCGVCKIKILSGDYHTKAMSREKLSQDEENSGYALACRVYPNSDMLVEAVKTLTPRKQTAGY